ncbi:TRAP transporter small permease [Isoptericola sp. 4D.3]|uniref:TRAP transporter small permease n=1 Tax=Isoptericola peretonis TaxID=2918523 RepID=A0ABT0J1S5_9MICO|nr:TRAP transporter small permease [Isoptericola sp. 4D.3]
MKRLVRILTALELGVVCLAVAMIFLLVLYQAAQRFVPVPNVVWTGELSEFALIWLTFGAAGVLVTRDGHIALQLVDNLPRPGLVRAIQVLALLLVAVIATAFAWACWELVSSAGFLTSPALGLPMSWVYAITLVGLVSTTIRAVARAVGIARGAPLAGSEGDDAPAPATGEVQA